MFSVWVDLVFYYTVIWEVIDDGKGKNDQDDTLLTKSTVFGHCQKCPATQLTLAIRNVSSFIHVEKQIINVCQDSRDIYFW